MRGVLDIDASDFMLVTHDPGIGAVYKSKSTGKYGFVVEGEDFLREPTCRSASDADDAMGRVWARRAKTMAGVTYVRSDIGKDADKRRAREQRCWPMARALLTRAW